MFHNSCSSGGNYGSIFNNTFNISCGGHGGFWSGFGLGLGNAFGSIFGGFLGGGFGNFGFGGFGGGFGGFGGFGLGGFGFPSFGGGGWGNFWNGTPAVTSTHSSSTCDCGCKDKKTKDTTTHECNDPDLKRINDYDTEVVALENTPNKDKAKKLYKRIKDSMDKQDDVHKAENTTAYQKLLDRLKAKYPDIDKTNASEGDDGVEEEVDNVDDGSTLGSGNRATDTGIDTTGTGTADTVTINGNPVKLSDLTAAQIADLTPEQIGKLKPEQAKALLEKLGLLCKDDSGKDGVKATTNYKALLLVQQSGLPLACGHNTALDSIDGADAYINGTITDVKIDGETITFIIDDDNAKYKMSCKADSTKYQIAELVENKTSKYKTVKLGTEYEIKEDDNDDYAVRNGEAAIR